MRKLLLVAMIMACGVTATMAQQGNDNKAARQEQRRIELSKPWQVQYIIGANVACEGNFISPAMTGGPTYKPVGRFNPGVSFAVHLTRHSGIEIGVNYRVDKSKAQWSGSCDPNVNPNPVMRTVYTADRYISIPVVYKYYSRVLNFVAGVNYDIMIDTDDKVNRYAPEDRNVFGLVVGVTKDIKLCKGLMIEPYFSLNPTKLFSDGDVKLWISGGIGLKYAFR